MPTPLLANARLYAVTPAAKAGWERLFEWLAGETGLPVVPYDHPVPTPMPVLWDRPDLACAFMCGWPYAKREPKPHLLAAPVPSPARYGGEPVYVSDLVVRRDGPFRTLPDTFGGTVGWTVEDSHSGFNALRHHLLGSRSEARPRLYSRTVGGLFNPIGALKAVADGTVDVAPVDGFCHDLFRAAAQPVTEAVRVVASTSPSPIPPLIASHELPDELAARIRAALLVAHADPALAPTLDAILVARFVAVAPERYRATRDKEEAALAAGYPMPA